MSLLTPLEVRETIQNISKNEDVINHCANMKGNFTPEDAQAYFETMYIGRFRTGELCGVKFPSDKNKNTGHTLRVYQTNYTPDDNNEDEIDTLTRRLYVQNLRAGKKDMPTLEDILTINEPVMVLQVQVEKRKDMFVRHTAIPLRAEIEPMAKNVLAYIEARQDTDSPVFSINRTQALHLAHKIFCGSKYQIRAYRRYEIDPVTKEVVKKPNSKGELKAVRILIQSRLKDFGNHAVRHAGIEELKKKGIRGHRLTAFVGWSPKDQDVLEEVYDQNDKFAACRLYLPYMITGRF